MVVTPACEKCVCCTPCRQECGCAADEDETENELVFRIRGINKWDPKLLAVQETLERFEAEEKDINTAKSGISKHMGQEQSSEEGSECEDAVDEGEEDY